MNLDRDFAGPQFKSYLLVEHARHHKAHDLALACGQRRVALLQLGEFTVALAHRPVAIQSLVNRIQQLLVAKRLRQELHRTRFHGLTVIGMSRWPVMKMMGISTPASANSC